MPSPEWYQKNLLNWRGPLEDWRSQMLEIGQDAVELDAAIAEFRKQAGKIRHIQPPPMLLGQGSNPNAWYQGAEAYEKTVFWPSLRQYLEKIKCFPAEAVASLHQASDKIVSWLENPTAAEIHTRGLVVGYVQSGKTANFTAVISKAADAGYQFFIVLSGTKNALRAQTQRRLDAELIDLNPSNWFSLTTIDHDFKTSVDIRNPSFFLTQHSDKKVICVVKKNATILRRLHAWFNSASHEVLRKCPFVVIDDEADEASVNTAPNQAYSDPEDARRTAALRHVTVK